MEQKLKFAKKILPILISANSSDYNFYALKKEIDDSVDKVCSFLEIKDKNDMEYFSFLFSLLMNYEVLVNKNCYIDDMVDELIIYLNENKNILNEEKEKSILENKISIEKSTSKVFTKICIYHNTLLFSSLIDYQRYRELNKGLLEQSNKIIISLIYYLKKNNINDKKIISEMIDIAVEIYVSIVSSFLGKELENEKISQDYCDNQKKYLNIFENIFLEQYSELNSLCQNIKNHI